MPSFRDRIKSKAYGETAHKAATITKNTTFYRQIRSKCVSAFDFYAFVNSTTPSTRPLGEYRGFKTDIGFNTISREFFIILHGALSHKVPLGQDANGIITRLDNAIENFENRKQGCELKLEELRNQVENAKAEIAKPFPREAELDEKCKRLAELNAELDMDKRENEIVDDAEEQSEDDRDGNHKSRNDRDER